MTQPFASRTILIVEDEFFIGSDLQALLKDAGAEAELVNSAAEALEKLGSTQFDAALLDVHLADGSTYPVADDLRRRNTPFAFISGYLTIREGYADIPFLEKPFTADSVKETLATLLTEKAA